MERIFKILAIDGGGYRGVYPAYLMKRMEEELGTCWCDEFDLIAGTSTGSIIAAGVVCGKTAGEIASLYRNHGKRIFRKRLHKRLGLFSSKYGSSALRALLEEAFGDSRLGDISFPLIIPATDIGNGCVHVFKSSYDAGFVRDKTVRVADAVLASCSAPTYFDPHVADGKYLLADGGLWANSPSLVATIDAKKRLDADLNDVRILSIGTGTAKSYYPQRVSPLRRLTGWGFATRWGRQKFIGMLLNLQSQTANNMLNLLLRPDQIVRISFESDTDLALDDPKAHSDLVAKADHDFTHNAEKIRTFLACTGAES